MERKIKQAVILAGGLGTRLGSLTQNTPKALIQIGGKPFLHYQLEWLAAHGFKEVLLCVGHLADPIEAAAGEGSQFGLKIRFSREREKLLGTAGAVKHAEALLDDAFCILNGDSYLPIEVEKPIGYFEKNGFEGMLLAFRNRDQYDKSNMAVKDGWVTLYDRQKKTPEMEFIDYGLQMFKKTAFKEVPEGVFTNLDLVYQNLIQEKKLAAYEVHETFYEIGSLDGLNRFKEYAVKTLK